MIEHSEAISHPAREFSTVLQKMWGHSELLDLTRSAPFAESAIEQHFYAFLIGVLEKKGFHIEFENCGTTTAAFEDTNILIAPQFEIDRYRVDFLIGAKAGDVYKEFVFECDGADFHYATWAQIKRDRERDRHIESLGYEVIRFPGTQIYNNTFSCLEPLSFAIGAVAQ